MTKYKKILAYPLGGTWRLYVAFMAELHYRNYFDSATIITFRKRTFDNLKRTLNSPGPLRYEHIDLETIPSIAGPDLERLERLYGIPNLGLIDLITYRTPHRRLRLPDYFYFWENYLSAFSPNMIITPWPASIRSLSLVLVAAQMKLPVVMLTNARTFGRSILRDGNNIESLFDLWPGLAARYRELKEIGLSSVEQQAQWKKIERIRQDKPKPIWLDRTSKRKLRLVKNLIVHFSWSSLRNLVVRRWRRNFHKFEVQKLPSNRFIFYPLHFEPEMSLDLLAPFFRKQDQLIEFIHQALPAGVTLAVKEHPNMVGRRSKKFYKSITALKNVALLAHEIDSYDIIDDPKCEAVVTINSTAGYEAMMLQRPVVAFGKAFYIIADDLVKHVTDLTTLPDVLAAIKQFRADEENLLCFLKALDEFSFEATIAPPFDAPWVMSDKNIKAIAKEFERRYPAYDQRPINTYALD